ncbi:tryptophan synthase subunit alpha [Acidobacteria bacterium AH-259-L09]|nr:tryptophan synthase subunit alpha [Acidobacteria bacterium AH-259-L09]
MSRLSEIFAKNKKCFIPFVTAGHPDLAMSREIILNLAAAGSHMVEIGIPFSDPIADGPIIQKSSFEALKHGYSFSDYIDLVRQLRAKTDLGLIFMTYINPVLKYGLKQLDREGSEAGLDGVLISDLTPEEYSRMEPLQALDTIFLAAPTSSDERLKRIGAASRGFVYLIARTGVTGTQSDVEHLVPETVARLRRYTRLPIAVGFGITSSKDVRKVWQYADGAVVGSAIVRFIEEHQSTADLARKVGEYVRKDLISKA